MLLGSFLASHHAAAKDACLFIGTLDLDVMFHTDIGMAVGLGQRPPAPTPQILQHHSEGRVTGAFDFTVAALPSGQGTWKVDDTKDGTICLIAAFLVFFPPWLIVDGGCIFVSRLPFSCTSTLS